MTSLVERKQPRLPRSGVAFFAIEQRCDNPDQKNRSHNEIDEVFGERFAGQIKHGGTPMKEPAKKEKEWRRDRDGNEENAKPATTEQRECSCDERQKRKGPDGRCPCRLEPTNRHDS